ncbi:MAG: endo-1,4-beta-xylanase [Spirochaetota bacterium]
MEEQLVVRFTTVRGEPALPRTMYTVNERGFPFFSEWRMVGPGELAIRYPKETPFAMEVLWEIPGFGRVIVTADNSGELYRPGGPPVDFRAEAVSSKAIRLRRTVAELRESGYQIPEDLGKQVDGVLSGLRPALDTSNPERRARLLDELLCTAFRAAEELELLRARADLDAMSVKDRRSKLFGSSFFDPDASETFLYRFEELFNFATTPFYRRAVEPEEGKPDWTPRDRLLDWLDEKAIERKGHPLSWWIEHGLADWMKKLSYKTLKEVIYQQVYDTVSRYKDRIHIWDVINEAHDPIVKGNDLNLNEEQVYEVTELACRATRDADPSAIRIVNVNRPWGVYRSEWETMDPMHPIEYVERLAERGIEYEVLGVQMYHGGPEHYVRDMTEQSAMIDRYLALGKPVHITEVQTPSSMEADSSKWLGGRVAPSGWWHRPWDAEVQADWAEQFYTIAASKRNLEAITWWSLSDRRTFWPHGGLLDMDDNPKPAYHRLLSFIRRLQQET